MTFDTPAPGVVIAQPARGFRYTSDAMWLVGFALATGPRPMRALDLGTGSGVVAALLAARGIASVGVDVREEWTPLWAETLARSAPSPLALRRAEIADGIPGPYDLVVSNPPFFAAERGPMSPDPWKRAARTESTATVGRFVEVAIAALAPGGRACVVVDRTREPDVFAARGALAVTRWVRVGRRRSLLCLADGPPIDAPELRDDADPEVRGWVAAATTPGR